MRVVTAAVAGAVCAAAWWMSFVPIGRALCDGLSPDALGCAGLVYLWVAPISAVVWAVVAWALLRLARPRPVWPTAVLGPVGSFVLALAGALTIVGMRARPPEIVGVLVVTISAGVGYALAAAVTAGYGGRRDGAEHRGQDG
ncbi:hypothetical protein SK854_15410 [Lentzea sp. BCCO 10_0061]|uniref:Transmembrane protein n=1 Tax=Lentzea sokolovensis TaxID=3095429 RepID=A0ABU4UVH8_9PSEU|nr:hypothetical protein [Lentzea sp. BCCO 10_0061]MDX8143512.1 hypothetical protein [Lentzea sp. BCCO 10_0061]